MIHWRIWSRASKSLLLLLFLCQAGRSQDLEHYYNLVYQGRAEEVAEALPQLYRQHPNDGSVLFLEGLITNDGELALEMYKKVSRLYPTSPYADDALMKIGEYLYARGLYIQAAQYLQRIPVHYPRSNLLYPSIRLFLNAMIVSGNRDTALFYAQVFSKKYPDIEFDLEAGRAAGSKVDTTELVSERPPGLPQVAPEVTTQEEEREPAATVRITYRLQAGAFGMRENAERRKAVLQSLNYRVKIVPTRGSRGRLYLVMVEGFNSRAEAERAGQRLSDNYGIENFIVQNN